MKIQRNDAKSCEHITINHSRGKEPIFFWWIFFGFQVLYHTMHTTETCFWGAFFSQKKYFSDNQFAYIVRANLEGIKGTQLWTFGFGQDCRFMCTNHQHTSWRRVHGCSCYECRAAVVCGHVWADPVRLALLLLRCHLCRIPTSDK